MASSGGVLIGLVVFWVVYFSLIYVGLSWFYFRLTGVRSKGADGTAWDRRALRLKRALLAAATALVLLPLLLPLLARLF